MINKPSNIQLRIAFLFLLPLTLLACSDQRIEDIRQRSLAEILAQSGWQSAAKTVDPLVTVDVFVKDMVREKFGRDQSIDWRSEKLGEGIRVSALAQLESLVSEQQFYFHPMERSTTYLQADARLSHLLSESPSSDNLPLQTLDRLAMINRMNDGDAQYQWEGCFIHSAGGVITGLELRATLLSMERDGRRDGYVGKILHATKRSGIPEKLAPGEFFCAKLKSGPMPVEAVERGQAQAMGVLEAHWIDDAGKHRFAAILRQKLSWGTYEGLSSDSFAVLSGGELTFSDSQKEALTLPDPSLVTLLKRQGSKFLVRLVDGRQGFIKAANLIAIYPRKSSEEGKKVLPMIHAFVGKAIKGDMEGAVKMFDPTGSGLKGQALAADIKRRFGSAPKHENGRITVHILDFQALGELSMLSYFLWLRSGEDILWQTYETVFFRASAGPGKLVVPEF